jgi:hypothetical protein
LPRLQSVAELEKHAGYVFEETSDGSGFLRIRHDEPGDVEITGAESK